MSKTTMPGITRDTDTNAIAALKNDHTAVQQLFDRFEDADNSERQEIIDEAIQELKIHATLEEEIFYPALRGSVDDDLMNEAEQEHHVARMLIAELELKAKDEGRRHAKFMVLAENVKHHIKEEEGQIFPAAEDTDIDFDELGIEMDERRQTLISEGVPEDAEHEMVSSTTTGGRSSTLRASTGKTSRKGMPKAATRNGKKNVA